MRQIPPHVRDEAKTFEKAVEMLNAKRAAEHAKNVRKSGLKPKPSMEYKLLAILEYLWEYRTMAHIAASHGVAESNIHATSDGWKTRSSKTGLSACPEKRRC